MRLGILECDHVDARYAGIAGDYQDMFIDLLAPHDAQLDPIPYDVCNGTLPSVPTECDAWLITGSRRSVYDELAWIEALSEFVRRVHDASVPCAGICFGHQLIAHALGGTTERAPTGWGAGAHQIELSTGHDWMNPPSRACNLLFMHQDQVTALPPKARVLGRTQHCPVAALTVGPATLGMQAHPEFPVAYIEALLTDRVERIGSAKTEAARASLSGPLDAELVGQWLVRFLNRTAA